MYFRQDGAWMKKINSLFNTLKTILINIRNEHIGAFAAQSSFFFIMSFFPMVFLVLTVLKISGNNTERFTNIILNIIPYVNREFNQNIFEGFTFKPIPVISVTTILIAWSAGKSFYALSEGFHSILSVKETHNYFVLRIRGLVYSLVFAFVIALLFFISVFGDGIHSIVLAYYPTYSPFTYLISGIRKSFIIFVLFINFALIYFFLPDRSCLEKNITKKTYLKINLISALIVSIVIYFYTAAFSVFAGIYIKHNHIYGGLAAFISLMLWIYGSMYILILGFYFSVKYSKKGDLKKFLWILLNHQW